MDKLHPLASEHLPGFITAPGSTDVLMVVAGVVLLLSVLGAGVFFLWLHSLPERLVHNRLQYDIVAVLALLSLFTHVHAFWIAALLLAFITIPDLSRFNVLTPLRSIAQSLRSLANSAEAQPAAAQAPTAPAPALPTKTAPPPRASDPGRDTPAAKEE